MRVCDRQRGREVGTVVGGIFVCPIDAGYRYMLYMISSLQHHLLVTTLIGCSVLRQKPLQRLCDRKYTDNRPVIPISRTRFH